MKNEAQLLKILYSKVAQRLDQGDYATWKNKTFLLLEKEIFNTSSILISSSTLKRLFGKISVDEDYSPQIETKNALAIYAGYKNWEHFQQSFLEQETNTEELQSAPPKKTLNKYTRYWSVFVLLIFVVGIVAVVYYQINQTKISLSVNRERGSAPMTLSFYLQGEVGDHSNTFLIIEDDTIFFKKHQKEYVHFFKLPGYVVAELWQKKKLVQKIPILIESNGWKGYAHTDFGTHKLVPCGTLNQNVFQNDSANHFFTEDQIKSLGIVSSKLYMTEYRYIQQIDIDPENFTASLQIKNNGCISAVFCDHIVVCLYTEQGLLSFRFVKSGCNRWSNIILGDQVWDGMEKNLDFMSGDFSYFRSVSVTVDGINVTLKLDDLPIFQGAMSRPLKAIYGLSIHFTGLGAFTDININDGQKQLFIPAPK